MSWPLSNKGSYRGEPSSPEASEAPVAGECKILRQSLSRIATRERIIFGWAFRLPADEMGAPGRTMHGSHVTSRCVCVFKAPRTRGAGPLGVGQPTRLTDAAQLVATPP